MDKGLSFIFRGILRQSPFVDKPKHTGSETNYEGHENNYRENFRCSNALVLCPYCSSRHTPYAHTTGTANSMASMRSSMPPWPGRMVPESFTPAPRLMRDST